MAGCPSERRQNVERSGRTWQVRATGNVTLAIVDDRGERVVTLSLVNSGAMRPSRDGRWLAQAYNNLVLLASAAGTTESNADLVCPDPEAGLAPFPWRVIMRDEDSGIRVEDRGGRLIAERLFPARWSLERRAELRRDLLDGVERLNAALLGQPTQRVRGVVDADS